MTSSKKYALIIIMVLAGLSLHLAGITRPFLGNFAQHQTDYATVVGRFLEAGIKPELPVMKFIAQGKERLFLGDLPLTITLTAILCKTTGLSIEVCGRGLSAVFFLLSLYPFFRVCRIVTGSKAVSCWALFFYVLSPLTIVYGQSFLLEMPALFFLLCALYMLFLWRDNKKRSFLILSAFLAAFAIALRIYYSFILVPVLALFMHTYRQKTFIRADLYGYLAIALSIVCAWQFYTSSLAGRYGSVTSLQDNLTVFNITRGFPDLLIYKAETYKVWLDTVVNKLVTPAGAVFALIGIFVISSREGRGFVLAYFVSFAFMAFVTPRKFYEFDYYYLPLIPLMALAAGLGIEKVCSNILKTGKAKYLIAALVFVLALRYSFAPAFITPAEDRNVLRASGYVREMTDAGSRIIASHGTSTSFLYYCNRPGWAFELEDDMSGAVRFRDDNKGSAIDRLERFRSQGAKFFAVTDKNNLESNRALYDHLVKNYRAVLDRDGIMIFDLKKAG